MIVGLLSCVRVYVSRSCAMSLSHLMYKMSHIIWLQNYGDSKVDHVCFVS